MPRFTKEQIEKHIKTHSERSVDDACAVSRLETILLPKGRIITAFNSGEKWPNTDGSFELVPDPEKTRSPKKNFIVQIKGTSHPYETKDGIIHYSLKNLAFPAYIANEVTLDPGILFVVINPQQRDNKRFFWKYMSPKLISSIDFNKDSCTLDFSKEDEIEDTDESVLRFAKKLNEIADVHSYIKQLDSREFSKADTLKVILARCDEISEAISFGAICDYSRDLLSKKMFTALEDLCAATLLLNGFTYAESVNLQLAWEIAVFDNKTKFLATFLRGLKYIGLRVPEDGQYERLMLKYYEFLWKIREYLFHVHSISVLQDLEMFPKEPNEEDEEYNRILAEAIEQNKTKFAPIKQSCYYIQKKTPFFVGRERYFEITLQLANKYATKYNRLTAYTKIDISTNYAIRIASIDADVALWDKTVSKIKVITDWAVFISPRILNKLSQIVKQPIRISSTYNEFAAFMSFLKSSGINFLDLIDMRDSMFQRNVEYVFSKTNTTYLKGLIEFLHNRFNAKSRVFGRNTVRYFLLRLKEDLLDDIIPSSATDILKSGDVFLSKKCYAFELNPILYNLPNSKTNGNTISRDVLRSVGTNNASKYLPFIRMKQLINSTGELLQHRTEIEFPETGQTIEVYNSQLNDWDISHGQMLKCVDDYVNIEGYVNSTISILRSLLELSKSGNDGQQKLNESYLSSVQSEEMDDNKIQALKKVFVFSKDIVIYGAAGTGKTTLMNCIAGLMRGRNMIFLSKTHTALENLQRRITSAGPNCRFIGIDRFINSSFPVPCDIYFVDECSVIDNRTMQRFLEKADKNALYVFAGDIYQLESIDFGNWFFYAKTTLPQSAIVELTNTWRTQEQILIDLWEDVRNKSPIITERLVIDGPFSEDIGAAIFNREDDDEVVLCLNYDGKFGLNSINSYFQDHNPEKEVFYWDEWKYKRGDPILFNDSRRFPMLYNNLKGVILDIKSDDSQISFTVEIPIILTAMDIRNTDLELIQSLEQSSVIRFTVYDLQDSFSDDESEDSRIRSIVPFQLAYAVSIHKAQGLEYNSIKVIIPSSNSERITHGVFYTAITRAKKKLKVFWSSDTMKTVINGFYKEEKENKSLSFVRGLLDNN